MGFNEQNRLFKSNSYPILIKWDFWNAVFFQIIKEIMALFL